MHKYTYEFLKTKTITSDLFSLSNIITDLRIKTDSKKASNKSLFSKLESIAIKESVEGSNAIEGIFTTEQRIKEIVENNSEPLTHSEEEIAGYYDAIKFIKENYEYLSFDEETIPDEDFNKTKKRRSKLLSCPNVEQRGPNINLKISHKRYSNQKEKEFFFEKIKIFFLT